jgi:hypothetical protein
MGAGNGRKRQSSKAVGRRKSPAVQAGIDGDGSGGTEPDADQPGYDVAGRGPENESTEGDTQLTGSNEFDGQRAPAEQEQITTPDSRPENGGGENGLDARKIREGDGKMDVEQTPKKGNVSWKPANPLAVADTKKSPGWKSRWVENDKMNVEKKLTEGWRYSKKAQEHSDGKSLTSTTEHRELILMEIDEETLAARTQYFQGKTDQQTHGLKKNAEAEMGQKLDGSIIIE